jgi:F-type H+-transporting ATPase subunit c
MPIENIDMYTKAAAFISAAFVMGIGAIGPTIGQGLLGAKAMEAMGKNPENASSLSGKMIIGMAIMETSSVFALIVAVVLLFLKT